MSSNKQYRDKWIQAQLMDLPKGSSILDAGAGECQYKHLCEHLHYTAQDFAQYDGVGDNLGLQTSTWDNTKIDIISDIAEIPVESNSFDSILCTEVFEHIPYPDRALKEFYRILTPGGKLILTAPFASIAHFSPYFFATGFSQYFYRKILAEIGFNNINISFNGNYFAYIKQELERLPSISQKYTNGSISFLDKVFIRLLGYTLKRLMQRDNGSEELLCFGLHVTAEK